MNLEKWDEIKVNSVASDPLRPHGLYSQWNSPGQNTGVGSLSLLRGIFPTQGLNPGLPHCKQILYHLSHQVWWQPTPRGNQLCTSIKKKVSLLFFSSSSLFVFFIGLAIIYSYFIHWFVYLFYFYCLVSFEEWSGDRTVSLLSFFILCLRQVNKILSEHTELLRNETESG